jgi:hypothetical protein
MAFSNDSLQRKDSNYIVNFNADQSLPLFGTILSIEYSNSDLSEYQGIGTTSLFTPHYSWNQTRFKNFSINQNTTNFTISTTDQNVDFQPGMYIMFGQSGGRNHVHRIALRTGLGTGNFYNQYTGANLSSVDAYLIKVTGNNITPRHGLLQDESNSIIVNVDQFGGTTGTGVQCKTFTALTMKSIHDEFYSNMFNALQVPKIISCWVVLDTLEFYKLDQSTPIYIKFLNGTYHLNKLEQWKLNEPCRVELIRVNEFQKLTTT